MKANRRMELCLLLVASYTICYPVQAQMTTIGQPHKLNFQTVTVTVPRDCEEECTALVAINEAYVMVHFKNVVHSRSENESLFLRKPMVETRKEPVFELEGLSVSNGTQSDSFYTQAAKRPEMVVASIRIECAECATMVDIRLETGDLRNSKSILVGLDWQGKTNVLDLERYRVTRGMEQMTPNFESAYEEGLSVMCTNIGKNVKIDFCYVDSNSNYHWGGSSCKYCGNTLVGCELFEHHTPTDEVPNSPCADSESPQFSPG